MKSKDIKEVYFEDTLYASVVDINNIPDGLSFLTNDDSYIQVGTWNYDENKSLEAHFHNYFERSSFRTQEVVYVIDGKIKCNLYKEDATFIESLIIDSGMLIIQYEGIHEYKMIEKSKILEVKNGPYFGPDKDRTRVNVKKD